MNKIPKAEIWPRTLYVFFKIASAYPVKRQFGDFPNNKLLFSKFVIAYKRNSLYSPPPSAPGSPAHIIFVSIFEKSTPCLSKTFQNLFEWRWHSTFTVSPTFFWNSLIYFWTSEAKLQLHSFSIFSLADFGIWKSEKSVPFQRHQHRMHCLTYLHRHLILPVHLVLLFQTYLKCTGSCLLCQHIDKLSSGNRRDQNTLDTWTMIQPNHILLSFCAHYQTFFHFVLTIKHSSIQTFLGMSNRHNDTEIFTKFWLRCHKHFPLFH